MNARIIMHGGDEWVNVDDLRDAMNDDDLIMKAAAMLKVSHEKGDSSLETIRRAIAYFFTELTGALKHLEN